MMRHGKWTWLIGLAMLVCLRLALAQEDAPPSPGSSPTDTAEEVAAPSDQADDGGDKSKVVLVEAEQLDMESAGDGIWIIDGDVEMTQEDTKMYASHCVWDRNANTAVLTDNVRIVPKDHTITADRCNVDFDTKVAVLESDAPRRVHIVSEKEREADDPPDPDDEGDKYEHMVWETDADRVEYDYGVDKGVAYGNIITKSEDGKYTIYSDSVHYEELGNDESIITIPDSPRVETEDDEWFTCESAVINSKADGAYDVKLIRPSAHVIANKEDGKSSGNGGTSQSEQDETADAVPPASDGPPPSRPLGPPKDGGGADEGGQG